MWKNSKLRIYCLVLFILIPINLYAEGEKNYKSLNSFYELNIPEKLILNISGNNYIKYLKQIRNVSKRDNLNARKINSTKKKWVKASLTSSKTKKNYKIRFILHGDFNEHIGIPYSSLRVKSKNEFFHQLRDFILFKPKTRRYEAEVFGTIFLRELGVLAPFTRYVKLSINENNFEDYIFQEKISKYMVERYGLREGPILEYDEKNFWNKYVLNVSNENSPGFYKIENSRYASDIKNLDQIFESVTAKKFKEFFSSSTNNELFETTLILMGGCHGLHEHNRKYYYDSLNQIFLPIYYDGMLFYDKSNNLCETFRKTSQYIVTKKKFDKIKKIINDPYFKSNIKKKFKKYTFPNDKFDYFWNYLEKNLIKLEQKIEIKNYEENENTKIKKVNLYENLKKLELPYPTIFFYKSIESNNFFLCYEWFNLSSDIKIFYKNKILSKKENQGCEIIKKQKVIDLLKQKITFKTNLKKDIEITPLFVGNIDKNYNFKNDELLKIQKLEYISENIDVDIDLEDSTIAILSLKKESTIKNLKINSSLKNNSALILKLENKNLDKIEFNQGSSNTNGLNNIIMKKNITGCLSIINSSFNIKNLIINGSNCEDGINIINSSGKIDSLEINDAISDGLDFDYSKIEIDNVKVNNARGDCLDFSFGNYIINKSYLDICGDKAISVGETSKLIAKKVNISNSNFGIASKDNSTVYADNINIEKIKYCLAVYNKKKEFSGGKINFKTMNCNNFYKEYSIDQISEIKKGGKIINLKND